VHPIQPETIYAASDRVYKSTDGGANWRAADGGLTSTELNCLVIVPDAPNIILTGTADQGVFRSTDGGVSWQAANTGLSNLVIWHLAVSPTDSRTIFAATDDGVYRSDDRGLNWMFAGSAADVQRTYCLAIHPTKRRMIYAGTAGGGVLVSTDNGLTWAAINDGLGNDVVQALTISTDGCARLYAGTDNGIWERAGN